MPTAESLTEAACAILPYVEGGPRVVAPNGHALMLLYPDAATRDARSSADVDALAAVDGLVMVESFAPRIPGPVTVVIEYAATAPERVRRHDSPEAIARAAHLSVPYCL